MANKSEQIKILVSIPDGEVRDSFFSEEQRVRLERLGCVEWNANAEQYGEEELAEKLRGVDICISGWGNTPFHEKTLKYADKLKLIAHIGGSVRPMVGDAAFERGDPGLQRQPGLRGECGGRRPRLYALLPKENRGV